MSKFYDIKLTGGEKVLITAEEVITVIGAKSTGSEFVRVRDNFINPKYIVSITPNYNHESNVAGGRDSNPLRRPNLELIEEIKKLKGGHLGVLKPMTVINKDKIITGKRGIIER